MIRYKVKTTVKSYPKVSTAIPLTLCRVFYANSIYEDDILSTRTPVWYCYAHDKS